MAQVYVCVCVSEGKGRKRAGTGKEIGSVAVAESVNHGAGEMWVACLSDFFRLQVYDS